MANFTSTHTGAVIDAAVTKITATSSSATELNLLDGVTSTTAEINILDGVTSTTAEINILDGVTATTAEINLLDGLTATTTELNLIDGVTATTAEINYIDGVTSNIQTQLNLKAPLAGASLTGTTSFQNLSDGTITITAFADEDDMSSNSATLIPTQQSVKAYVDTTAQTTEEVQDIVGAMFTSNTESGITVAYQDGDGTIDLTVATQSDNNFTTTLKNKLDAIEASATADQTASEIRTLVESASDSNVFTDDDHSKLNAIEASADVTDTANVTSAGALMDSELTSIANVKALDQSVVSGATPTFTTTNFTDASNKRLMTDAQETKLDSVESSADVTDTANVTSAGALMDSELTDLAGVKGVTISTLQPKPSEGAFANGDKTKLDAIEAGATADQTDEEIQDVVGAMFSSNTETGITATYQDGDGTIDLVVGTLNQDTTGNADTATKIASITNSDIVQLTSSQTLTNKTLTSPVLNTGVSGSAILDEDNMASNSATKLSSQQSIKAYVDAEVAGVVDSSPAALNTLNELAAALGDDANFSTTTSTSLGNRLRVDTASQGLNGTQQANAITNLGITSTKAELNILDGVTSTAAELNILDGVTSSAAELNVLDGITSTTAELNILDGVTSTAAELNILDGVTATAAELNIMDGVTATTAELNYVDGVTSNIQTQLDSKIEATLTTEQVQDIVGGMFSSNTETRISATYEDGDGTIDLVVDDMTANTTYTAGTGLDLSTTEFSVDVSDFMSNGSNNRILTATGTDAMNAEANLTFDGSHLRLPDSSSVIMGASDAFVINHNGSHNYIQNTKSDADVYFTVNDGGVTKNALIIDSSENGSVKLPNDLQYLEFGVGGDGILYSYDDDFWIQNVTQDQDIKFRVNDGGVHTDVMIMQGSTARVGIGTASPSSKLDVVGDTEINGLLYVSDSNDIPVRLSSTDAGFAISMADSNSASATHNRIGVTTNDMTFHTNNSEAMRINSSQNVGIGTASPSYKLHLEQAGGVMQQLKATDSAQSYMKFVNSTTGDGQFSDGFLFGLDSDETIAIWNYEATAMRFATSGAEKMRIDSSGQVGIGTTSPSASLHINTTNDASLFFTRDGGSAFSIEHDASQIYFYNRTISKSVLEFEHSGSVVINEQGHSTVDFRVEGDSDANLFFTDASADRVGIGTSSPEERLHLKNGNFRVGGDNAGSDYGVIFTPADAASYWHIYNDAGGHLAFGRSATIGSLEKMRIDSSGNVGIGTSSPSMKLNISHGDQDGLRFTAANTHETFIDFGDTDDNDAGSIRYDHNDNSLAFRVNASERVRINSDGDVLPDGNGTQDLGSSSKRWGVVHSADLDLSNEGAENDVDGTWGSYVIQEGEDDLFLINRRSGKKYKFMLQEVA